MPEDNKGFLSQYFVTISKTIRGKSQIIETVVPLCFGQLNIRLLWDFDESNEQIWKG